MPCSVHYNVACGNACTLILANKEMRKLKYEKDEQRGRNTDFTQYSKIRDYGTQKNKDKAIVHAALVTRA